MRFKLIVFNFLRAFEKIPGVRLYQVAHFGSVSIILVPKVATRSTRDALLKHHYPKISHSKETPSKKNRLAANYITYHSFTSLCKLAKKRRLVIFYRNHHERISSCWRQKVAVKNKFFYFWMYYPFLRRGMSEAEFIKTTSYLEPFFSEKHFEDYSRIYKIPCVEIKNLEEVDSFFDQEFGFTMKANVTR